MAAGVPQTSGGLIRRLPGLALLLAVAAVALLAAGPFGWRLGWLPYRIGLLTLMPYGGYVGVAAVVVAALALIAAIFRGRGARRGIGTAVLALLIGGTAVYFPWYWNHLRGVYPPINDITTDWDNPPQFQAILPLRDADHANPVAYGGDKVSALQRRAYPDIAPLILPLDPRKAFARARDAARQLGWTIVDTEPEAGRLEATPRSRWFGFTDDIVVRITAAGGGSRIDVRSVSRFGRSDFGVNATRVRAFLAAMRNSAAAG